MSNPDQSPFGGFADPKENWSKLPHEFIAVLPKIETLAEMKVILYVLRHTWGYRDSEKRITLEEFCNGRKYKDQTRIDSGTGMSVNAVKDGIERAIAHGFIVIAHIDDHDKARVKTYYALNLSNSDVRVSNIDGRVSEVDTQPSEVDPRSEKETSRKKPQKESGAKNAPTPSKEEPPELKPVDSPVVTKHKQAIQTACTEYAERTEGLLEHAEQVANPRAEQRAFVKEYAPKLAEILQHDFPSDTDKAAARQLFDKRYRREWLDERLRSYLNGSGAAFREKANANAYWILRQLNDDLASGGRVKQAETWDTIPRFKADD